jgi:hypothetical protein
MFDKNNKKGAGCFSERDFVSYLYNEMGEFDRTRLDEHIAECSSCTDEFAGLSESRFSVYEWQKLEFAGLETPEIAGPWQTPSVTEAVASRQPRETSWLDRLRAAIALRPGFALGGVALIIVALGIGFVVSQGLIKSANIADANVASEPAAPPSNGLDKVNPSAETRDGTTAPDKTTVVQYVPSVRHPVKGSDVQLASGNSSRTPAIKVERASASKQNLAPANRRAPRLSDFEEEEDNTVRLSDLLAEAGTDR